MKKLLSLLIFVVLTMECATAKSLQTKRDADAAQEGGLTGLLTRLIGTVQDLPIIGNLVSAMINLLTAVQEITNGALGRLLGGLLPCVLGDDTAPGWTCNGVDEYHGFSSFVEKLLDEFPPVSPPKLLKDPIVSLLRRLVDPMTNSIFGGQLVEAS
ncbi:uncharacterized protein LOC105683119 isoform X1 [Athalia rosae]|uniref:uncharacterized protein LOC105683119 isoform X1 n=1 Tax=Athalia rosae TaxID=37344 RepID=UPI00203356F1|nr:uncharacterized protein LOC105683119 isoform X1 [Athalia rosae]